MAKFEVVLTATALTECQVRIDAKAWNDALAAFNALTPESVHARGWAVDPQELIADVIVLTPSGDRHELDYPSNAPFEQLTLSLNLDLNPDEGPGMNVYRFVLTGDCLLSKTLLVDAEDVKGALAAFAALSPKAINALPWEPGALTVDEDVGVITDAEDADDVDELDEDFRYQLEMLFG